MRVCSDTVCGFCLFRFLRKRPHTSPLLQVCDGVVSVGEQLGLPLKEQTVLLLFLDHCFNSLVSYQSLAIVNNLLYLFWKHLLHELLFSGHITWWHCCLAQSKQTVTYVFFKLHSNTWVQNTSETKPNSSSEVHVYNDGFNSKLLSSIFGCC